MKNQHQLHAQREIDEEILSFVREMQSSAPVCVESVHSFLTTYRQRKRITEDKVLDRIDYLEDKGFLKKKTVFTAGAGDVDSYKITSSGRDVLDGAIPWK